MKYDVAAIERRIRKRAEEVADGRSVRVRLRPRTDLPAWSCEVTFGERDHTTEHLECVTRIEDLEAGIMVQLGAQEAKRKGAGL